jgi:hypothetical protein
MANGSCMWSNAAGPEAVPIEPFFGSGLNVQ